MRFRENLTDVRTRWFALGTLAFSAVSLVGVVVALVALVSGPGQEQGSLSCLATTFIAVGSVGALVAAILLNRRVVSIVQQSDGS
ncbi:hypothetical protein [Microbacterium sp. Se5.02b]|uniref:hypothetical protein n=1 Tax=Microbacterium sp. Se5.02b TaxID=2864103 RepID=UPI00160517ED|nr:hypothetical protein [Microbacterium sp. Se5.02b]QNA92011.1 hypothetical protein G4G29_05395 [Microbacterium sp. Se63.02b]QYM65244.1 hypothetical protein K1X59_05430 [Microbacterium sp. Se5.02b]